MKRTLALFALLIWCAVLLFLRIRRCDCVSFVFLVWNLFLAAIPYVAALAMNALDREQWRVAKWLAFVVWLLFLPNAPYIITDFIHLRERLPVPLWYDVLLLLSCAGTGLLLGYASLMIVQRVIERRYGVIAGWTVAVVTSVLSAFGIFLGRFLRRNSWDAFTDPMPLFADVAHRLMNPFRYPKTMAVTVLYGVALMLGYIALHAITVADESS